MKIHAELSLYPLRIDAIALPIKHFLRGLSQKGVTVNPGRMSTEVVGESEEVFQAIGECFSVVSESNEIVLVAKFSNACPEQIDKNREAS